MTDGQALPPTKRFGLKTLIRVLGLAFIFIAGYAVCGTVASLFDSYGFIPYIAAQFKLQYMYLLLPAILISAALKRWKTLALFALS